MSYPWTCPECGACWLQATPTAIAAHYRRTVRRRVARFVVVCLAAFGAAVLVAAVAGVR